MVGKKTIHKDWRLDKKILILKYIRGYI